MNFADKAIINILAKASRPFLMIFSGIIMVRVLTRESYGTYLQAMLIINTVLMFTFCGLPQSIYYYTNKNIYQVKFILRNLVLTLLIGLGASAVIYFSIQFIADWFNNQRLTALVCLISALTFFKASSLMREPVLIAHKKLKKNAQLNIICNILTILPLTVAALIWPDLHILLSVMLISTMLEFLVYLLVIFSIIREEKKRESAMAISARRSLRNISLLEQFRYSFPIGVSSYLATIGKQFDQVIVSFFFLPADFAVYSRGAIKIPVLSTMAQTVNNMMMPEYIQAIERGETNSFLQDYHAVTERIAKINFPIFSLLFAMSPLLITFLYTAQYAEASVIFRAYLLLLPLSITVYAIVPRITGKTDVILYTTFCSVLANVVLSLVLVKYWGAVGAAIATVIATGFSALFLLFAASKLLTVSFREIMPWANLGRQLMAALGASLPLYALNNFLPKSTIWLLAGICMDTVCYFFLVLFIFRKTRLIHTEDKQYLRERMPPFLWKLIRKII